ncbi:MAG TPA: maleylacetate reductase, partial [Bryobacteraceae bacterium]
MLPFVYEALPSRVIFGAGSLQKLPEEIDKLGATRALVLCSPEQRAIGAEIVVMLGARSAGVFDGAVMHVPAEVAEAARDKARRVRADLCVTIGGGSTTGLAKAIALTSELPILAIPTTYAGSEMTPIWGLTEGGVKKTGRDVRVLPRTVIYDPVLTVSLPVALSVTSGINAMAHCVEALYSKDANPIVSLIAEEGIRALAGGLREIVNPEMAERPGDLDARSRALYGAWLGGVSLGAVGMALHHKLCHTLGGTFLLPHAETHTVMLPHAVAYNATAAPEAMKLVARALGANSAAEGLYDLAASLGAPVSLKSLGMRRDQLDQAADVAVQNPY